MSAVPVAAGTSSSWMPTRKWWSALAAGIFAIAGQALATKGWDTTEWGELFTLAAAMATAYGVPNAQAG